MNIKSSSTNMAPDKEPEENKKDENSGTAGVRISNFWFQKYQFHRNCNLMVSLIICVMQVRCSYLRFDIQTLERSGEEETEKTNNKRRNLLLYLWVSNLCSFINILFMWVEQSIYLKFLKLKG